MQNTHNTLRYHAWNPLEFWRVNGYMLALPVISIASERVFSTAGNIISSQRACLLPENANMLIFIKHNKAFYDIFKNKY